MGLKVERLWPGVTVVCIASGPSLTADDCDYVRGKARVVAVNDGIRLAPWADSFYSSDRYFIDYYKGLPSFTGPKFSIGSSVGKKNPITQYPDIRVLRNTGYEGLDLDPGGLRNGKNSGYAAVNLSVHLGASRILLLGYNMGHAPGGPVHFFGTHPQGLVNPHDHLFPTWRRLFATLVEPLQAAGVEILNCTSGTSLSCFPCADLRDALPASAEVAA